MAITAPLLERLHALRPGWRLTVRSGLPAPALHRRIQCPFDLVKDEYDFGLRMRRDLSVDVAATAHDYTTLHKTWAERVAERAEWLRESGCDLLLSNISYLNIAAADRAGIPAIALSPLNWADLFRYFAPRGPGNDRIFEQMVAAYNRASVFLAPEPCMPMPHFNNVEVIPPVVQTGTDHRSDVLHTFGLDDDATLLLLALGGQEADLNAGALPRLSGTYWLVDGRYELQREDILTVDRAGLAFPDLLASSDLLVCKPGYGAFAEAACLGKPVVYIRRPEWPEETYLIDWLEKQVPCREGPRDDPRGLGISVKSLLDTPPVAACRPAGVDICCQRVLDGVR